MNQHKTENQRKSEMRLSMDMNMQIDDWIQSKENNDEL
jgi:hypothetical protein